MINVLIFLGSPRKKGNTEALLERVMRGVREAGAAAELIRLPDLDIHPCLGCGDCEKTGQCVIKDDMRDLYQKIDHADRVVIGSPIYFYGLTAQTKAFVDRCQALWSRKYCLGKRRAEDNRGPGYFVSVAATKGERIFNGAILTAQYGLDAMDLTYGGELLVRGVDKRGEIKKFDKELERACQFGKDIVAAG